MRTAARAGVTTVGRYRRFGSGDPGAGRAGGSGIAYQEVFGPHPSQAAGVARRACRDGWRPWRRFAGGRVRIGVSPHAPYTVSGPLYAAVAALGQRGGASAGRASGGVAPRKSELLARGTRAVRRGLARAATFRCLPAPPAARRSNGSIEHGVLGERTLCIHVVQARAGRSRRDWRGARRRGGALPARATRAHGHGDGAARRLPGAGSTRGRGNRFGAERRHASISSPRRAPPGTLAGLDADAALTLVHAGRRARRSGSTGEIGSLEPGKWGDCVVVRPRPAGRRSPAEAALGSGPEDVVATFLGGRDVYRAEPVRS